MQDYGAEPVSSQELFVVDVKRLAFNYDDAGNLDRIARYYGPSYQAEVSTDYAYDNANRITLILHNSPYVANYYAYDDASRITQFNTVGSGVVNRDFTYDDDGQLTSATGAASEAYTYDENGNRKTTASQTVATSPANRLEFDGTYVYEYDGEGNRTRRTDISSGETTVYAWDHRNRLVQVQEQDHTYVDFSAATLTSYSGQDGTPTNNAVLDDGRTLHLWGNTWKAVAVNYTLTADTVIELDFKSDAEREWQGIAFDTNLSDPQTLAFQFYGTQTTGQQAFNDYQSADGW